MKSKILQTLLIFSFVLLLARGQSVFATERVAGETAVLVANAPRPDVRAKRLRAYLASYNSPLAQSAQWFVLEADRNGLNWSFVAAIAGLESTFGREIPTGSYNGWGWGIFTGASDGVHFADWEDGITQVSEGLKTNYIDKGALTVEQIGRIYASSPTWAYRVRNFMTQINEFVPTQPEHIEVLL